MLTRVTFIGGPGNTLAEADWFIPNEAQRLSFPLRVPVDLDLSAMKDADRKFAEGVITDLKRMADYTVEEIDDTPVVRDHQLERAAQPPRRKTR